MLLPQSKTDPRRNPSWTEWTLWVEFTCSPSDCVGFLHVLQFLPTVPKPACLARLETKLPPGVSVTVCGPCNLSKVQSLHLHSDSHNAVEFIAGKMMDG